jgi:hypothetical protein
MNSWEEISPWFQIGEVMSPETIAYPHLIDVEALRSLNRLRAILGVPCYVNLPSAGLYLRGVRSWGEQMGLVEKGLTKARYSMHPVGKGFDVSAFSGRRTLEEISNAALAAGFTYTLIYQDKDFVHCDRRTVWGEE